MIDMDMTAQLAPLIWTLIATLAFSAMAILTMAERWKQLDWISTERLALAGGTLALIATLIFVAIERLL